MKRELDEKQLIGARLANNYGGWMYCDHCGENIGYLCYVTYDEFRLSFQCLCGNEGSFSLKFPHSKNSTLKGTALELKKNRFCCPEDGSALFTILDKKLVSYKADVLCTCGKLYHSEKEKSL